MRSNGVAHVVIQHYYYKQVGGDTWWKVMKVSEAVFVMLLLVSVGTLVAVRFYHETLAAC